MASTPNRLLGHLGDSVVRLEDPPLVAGKGRYAGDMNFPNQLHMRMVRSPYAHGEIKSIDTAEAEAMPGVVAVWTSETILDIPPIDFREGVNPALEMFRQYPLARGLVRYVGDPVAAVFAEDPYLAEDAAEMVVIHVDELPVLIDVYDPPQDFKDGTTEAEGSRTADGSRGARGHAAAPLREVQHDGEGEAELHRGHLEGVPTTALEPLA